MPKLADLWLTIEPGKDGQYLVLRTTSGKLHRACALNEIPTKGLRLISLLTPKAKLQKCDFCTRLFPKPTLRPVGGYRTIKWACRECCEQGKTHELGTTALP